MIELRHETTFVQRKQQEFPGRPHQASCLFELLTNSGYSITCNVWPRAGLQRLWRYQIQHQVQPLRSSCLSRTASVGDNRRPQVSSRFVGPALRLIPVFCGTLLFSVAAPYAAAQVAAPPPPDIRPPTPRWPCTPNFSVVETGKVLGPKQFAIMRISGFSVGNPLSAVGEATGDGTWASDSRDDPMVIASTPPGPRR